MSVDNLGLASGFSVVAEDDASVDEADPTRRWLKVTQKGWTDQVDR